MQIELTQGYSTEIDDIDADLADVKWRYLKGVPVPDKGYAVREVKLNGKPKAELLHRVIAGRIFGRSLFSNERCDHIDRDGLNNIRSNLRVATISENCCNRGIRNERKKTSKYKGVHYKNRASPKKWCAQVNRDGKVLYRGYFLFEEEAAAAYNNAANTIHGDFAVLNIRNG